MSDILVVDVVCIKSMTSFQGRRLSTFSTCFSTDGRRLEVGEGCAAWCPQEAAEQGFGGTAGVDSELNPHKYGAEDLSHILFGPK
jgi:hypothetical protein